jgi:putative RecB family exonuclease
VAATYSHSRLSCFETCPRQFFYRYVERRPVETESIEAFVGKRVHEVLERLNHFVGRGLVPSLAKVVARFRSLWAEHFDPERIRIVRAELEATSFRDLGERCLANHYRRHYPFDRDETIGIEEHVSFPLDADARYRIQGFVDRVARAPDGALEIHDYKTGRWIPSQETLDADRQLALYQIGVESKYGAGEPVRLVWHYLLRDQVRVSTRTPEQLAALRTETLGLIGRIEAETSFAPRPGSLCAWCEFNDVCPAAAARAREAEAPPSPDGALAPVDASTRAAVPPQARLAAPSEAKGAAAPRKAAPAPGADEAPTTQLPLF